jgi:hypothetical protein
MNDFRAVGRKVLDDALLSCALLMYNFRPKLSLERFTTTWRIMRQDIRS